MESYLTFIIAIGGIATGIGAVWTAMVARRQLSEQRRLLEEEAGIARRQAELLERSLEEQRDSLRGQNERARVSLEVDAMYKLWKQWESRPYQRYRRQGLDYVKEHYLVDDELLEVQDLNPANQLLFDFFNEVGYLVRTGVVSIERVETTYSRSVRFGWALFEPAVKRLREEYATPDRYADFEYLYHRGLEYERRRGGTGAVPTKAELARFVKGREPVGQGRIRKRPRRKLSTDWEKVAKNALGGGRRTPPRRPNRPAWCAYLMWSG